MYVALRARRPHPTGVQPGRSALRDGNPARDVRDARRAGSAPGCAGRRRVMVQRPVLRQPLLGLCVLVVEDDYFIALELCSALRAAGADVLGPARDLQAGLLAIE